MELFDIIAQIIGILAMAFNILSYQQKTRAQAIAFQLAGGLLFSINFFMLGAIVGAVLNAAAVVRAIIFLNKDRLRADRLPWLIGFISVFILTYILTFTLFDKEPCQESYFGIPPCNRHDCNDNQLPLHRCRIYPKIWVNQLPRLANLQYYKPFCGRDPVRDFQSLFHHNRYAPF